MKNFVIESLTPEHGKEIIKYLQSLGVDTGRYVGDGNKKNGNSYRFYGVIDDTIAVLSDDWVKEMNIPIVTIPTTPKRGDWVYVSDDVILPNCTDELQKCIFLTKIDGAAYPFVVVDNGYNEDFLYNKQFLYLEYKYVLPIPKKELLTVKDLAENSGISEREVEEIVLEHLKN